jgi:hypothetical protein
MTSLAELELRPAPQWVEVRSQRGTGSPPPKDKWEFERASEIEPTEVRYLWYPYVPAGRLTSIEGDPGIGKSWFTCALAGAVSNGTKLPGDPEDFQRLPGKVLMLSSEDGKADTLVPRLIAVGANLENIYFPKTTFTLNPDNISGLEKAMEKMALTMVFIDPVQYYMGSKVDINRANEVRGFMGMLHAAAERFNCAVVLVRHLNKKNEGPALYRGLGSIDFAAALRSVLHVSLAGEGMRHVHHVKCNNAPEGDTLTYSMEEKSFQWGPILPRTSFAPAKGKAISRTPRKQDLAQEFLREILATGPLAYTAILEEAERRGLSNSTLQLAKKGLAESKKHGNEWEWRLINDEKLGDGETGRGSSERSVPGNGPGVERGNGVGEGQDELPPDNAGSEEIRLGDGPPTGGGGTQGIGQIPETPHGENAGTGDQLPANTIDAARARLLALRGQNIHGSRI